MQVETFLFGSVSVNPEQIIEFPKGLVGFEDNKRFMLIHDPDTAEPVSYTLQSLDDPAVAVEVIDPSRLGFNYELSLDDEESTLIEADDPANVAVMLVIYKQAEKSDATFGVGANLRAPLILNTRTRQGVQKVMEKLRPNVTLSNLSSTLG